MKEPHAGVGAMLSGGTFGHGGAWGTTAFLDPQKGAAYVLMIQRSGYNNGDASELRRDFQQAAVDAIHAGVVSGPKL